MHMQPALIFLQYLLYMDPSIGLDYARTTDHCFAYDSTSAIRFANRACHSVLPTDQEISDIKSVFGKTQFTWAVDATDAQAQEKVKAHLNYKASFPAMKLSLETLAQTAYAPETTVKEAKESTDIDQWIWLVAPIFNVPVEELAKVVDKFKKAAPQAVKLYQGYYEQRLAAAAMLIEHSEAVSMHWVSTMPELRNKGLGFAVTHAALQAAKDKGHKAAVLLASAHGKSLYEKMGFKEYANYHMYGNY